MGYKGLTEIIQHKINIEQSEIRDNLKYLRTYYNTISLYLLRYLYDTWIIKQYDSYKKYQSLSIKDPIAPNGMYYEIRDLNSLKSKGITDKDKQISILNTWDKYTTLNKWIDNEPEVNNIQAKDVNISYDDIEYKIIMKERVSNYKKIKTLSYDKMTFEIYKDNELKAISSYYIYSPSKYILRYITLYIDEIEIIDNDHITEYNIDNR